MANERILVVDDEEVMRDILSGLMRKGGYAVEAVASGEEALKRAGESDFGVILLDLMLPGMDGLDTLAALRKLDPDQAVVMVTAYATVENAIEAMKRGAFEYLVKPFRNDEVLLVVKRALDGRKLSDENRALKRELRGRYGLEAIIGQSEPIRRLFDLVTQVAPSRSTILIEGEHGTGKELVARAIHHLSLRGDGPFVAFNSGNMPADLLESNLFGHVRGAFTGAVGSKKGLFEVAVGGSLFFDEISNVNLDVQAKLLRVLQEREYMPLGGTENVKSDVRIIAATNTNLQTMVEAGQFREDLYYRINVIRVLLPPLRDRREDIPLLVSHFLAKYARENDKKVRSVTPEAMRMLGSYDWPGNVRELENVIEKAVVLTRGDEIGAELVAEDLATRLGRNRGARPGTVPYKDLVEGFEREVIGEALRRAGGVQRKAAEELGLKPTTLSEKIKRLGLRV